ncbi:unnamed protein product [Taenia asiatica]|uniref:Protein Wnt n=1 Tax=Taenia asiatica TaxID=60517 RepID=A0A0R3VXT3_TAEAS|nr:unnamed protein product [Taenia asiatica]
MEYMCSTIIAITNLEMVDCLLDRSVSSACHYRTQRLCRRVRIHDTITEWWVEVTTKALMVFAAPEKVTQQLMVLLLMLLPRCLSQPRSKIAEAELEMEIHRCRLTKQQWWGCSTWRTGVLEHATAGYVQSGAEKAGDSPAQTHCLNCYYSGCLGGEEGGVGGNGVEPYSSSGYRHRIGVEDE